MNIDSYIPGNMDWAFLPANRKSADYEALLDDFLIYNFVTIQPPSKRIPFLGVFVNDM